MGWSVLTFVGLAITTFCTLLGMPAVRDRIRAWRESRSNSSRGDDKAIFRWIDHWRSTIQLAGIALALISAVRAIGTQTDLRTRVAQQERVRADQTKALAEAKHALAQEQQARESMKKALAEAKQSVAEQQRAQGEQQAQLDAARRSLAEQQQTLAQEQQAHAAETQARVELQHRVEGMKDKILPRILTSKQRGTIEKALREVGQPPKFNALALAMDGEAQAFRNAICAELANACALVNMMDGLRPDLKGIYIVLSKGRTTPPEGATRLATILRRAGIELRIVTEQLTQCDEFCLVVGGVPI